MENSWHLELLITSSHTVHTMNVNQLVGSISHLQAWLVTSLLVNYPPRTYMQILHIPHRGTSGVAILAAILDFTKNWKSGENRDKWKFWWAEHVKNT